MKKRIQTSPSRKIIIILVILLVVLLLNFSRQARVLTQSIFEKKVFPTDSLVPTILPQENKPLTQQDYVAKASEDLSEKLAIGKDNIRLVKVMNKEFTDTSLGCPATGKIYAQVITPGYQIVLEASGESYIYNAGLNIVITC